MVYEHNPNLVAVTDVIPHEPPRLWLSGVMTLDEIPMDVYQVGTPYNVSKCLWLYDEFMENERPTKIRDTVVRARGFWTPTDEQYEGHFPGLPVLQGVQQLESAAQLGAYAAMYEQPGKLGVFLLSSLTKYLAPVTPGDTLLLSADLIGTEGASFVGIGSVALEDGTVTSKGLIGGMVMKKGLQERMIQRAIASRHPVTQLDP